MQIKIMDKKQEAKFNMYHVVITRCDGNIAVLDLNVAFKNAFTDFKAIVIQIDAKTQQAGAVITGIAADKNVSEKDLCAVAARTAGLIYAYAAKTGWDPLESTCRHASLSIL